MTFRICHLIGARLFLLPWWRILQGLQKVLVWLFSSYMITLAAQQYVDDYLVFVCLPVGIWMKRWRSWKHRKDKYKSHFKTSPDWVVPEIYCQSVCIRVLVVQWKCYDLQWCPLDFLLEPIFFFFFRLGGTIVLLLSPAKPACRPEVFKSV